jgi:hypothetical protein
MMDYIIEWWLKRCPHDDGHVAADILEGAERDTTVKYCNRCGAVRINYSEWRRPRPLWYRNTKP